MLDLYLLDKLSSETNIHYNKDCDVFSVIRYFPPVLSETNIHYNKDCDSLGISLSWLLSKSETNIHYNKDCDSLCLRIEGFHLVGNKHPLQQGLRQMERNLNEVSFVGNKHPLQQGLRPQETPSQKSFGSSRKQTSTTTRIATGFAVFVLFVQFCRKQTSTTTRIATS